MIFCIMYFPQQFLLSPLPAHPHVLFESCHFIYLIHHLESNLTSQKDRKNVPYVNILRIMILLCSLATMKPQNNFPNTKSFHTVTLIPIR